MKTIFVCILLTTIVRAQKFEAQKIESKENSTFSKPSPNDPNSIKVNARSSNLYLPIGEIAWGHSCGTYLEPGYFSVIF